MMREPPTFDELFEQFKRSLKANNLTIINTEGLEERVARALQGCSQFPLSDEEWAQAMALWCENPFDNPSIDMLFKRARAALKAIGGE